MVPAKLEPTWKDSIRAIWMIMISRQKEKMRPKKRIMLTLTAIYVGIYSSISASYLAGSVHPLRQDHRGAHPPTIPQPITDSPDQTLIILFHPDSKECHFLP